MKYYYFLGPDHMKEPERGRRVRCCMPRCRKPLPEQAIIHDDPFCSSACCREYHGVSIQLPGQERGPVGASS